MLPVRIKGRTIMKRKLPKKLRQKTRSWRKRKESRTHEPSKWDRNYFEERETQFKAETM